MEQNGVRNPYFAAASSYQQVNHLPNLSSSLSRPYLMDPFPPFFLDSPTLDDQELAFALSRLNLSNSVTNNNAAFMKAQNGALDGGVDGDFLVGPGPTSYEDAARLFNSNVYNQHGPSYCFPDYHRFIKPTPHFPILSQNIGYDQRLMTILESNNFNIIKPKSTNVKHLTRRKQLYEMFCSGDFRGKLVILAEDQSWSKLLQMKIAEQNVEENEFILSEVINSVADLLINQFGSYFMQKLFLHCNEEQRTRIVVAVTRVPYQFFSVCLSSHGAKAMQIILENLSTPQQISLVMSALGPGTVLLTNDTYGHHVIQLCVESFPYKYNMHLMNEIAENCLRIAKDKSGCCVLQSCIEHSHGECRNHLIKEIIENAINIVEDPFGNYVVQHLLGLRLPNVTAALTRCLKFHFASLSCNKFASNVVEKFLVEAGKEHATEILKELLGSPNDVVKLLVDPYGNFVIQSALSVSKEMQAPLFSKLVELIIVNAPSIRSSMYAKKIFAWLKRERITSA